MVELRSPRPGLDEKGPVDCLERQIQLESPSRRKRGYRWHFLWCVRLAILFVMGTWSVLFLAPYLLSTTSGNIFLNHHHDDCSSIDKGYQCEPNISHLWGQYSPYFSLASESAISPDVPKECKVTFAQMLSRHGARFPTRSKGIAYQALVEGIQQNATKLAGKYAFLRDYRYTMGVKDLTEFGETQLVDSGIKFYNRYQHLARHEVPFIRASGSERVIASGDIFAHGFQSAKDEDTGGKNGKEEARVDVIIPEEDGFNNTLSHGTCPVFEKSKKHGDKAEESFIATFTPAIRARLETDMPGVSLSDRDIIHLMDLCSFDTVSRTPHGTQLSPFCSLFTLPEWKNYNHAKSVEKFHSFGKGNPLGPTQGIGFTNELIARLTRSPVIDHTSTNHTLDDNPSTFPLDRMLYADFTHDNSMTSIFFAMGLYNSMKPLSMTDDTSHDDNGYSAAWTVPFAGRMYVELMQCRGVGYGEPLVRVLVNDRVVPLRGCEVDEFGRCGLEEFVRGLRFARDGGSWEGCYVG